MSEPCEMSGGVLIIDENDPHNILYHFKLSCHEGIRGIGVEYWCKKRQVLNYQTDCPEEKPCEYFREDKDDNMEYCALIFFKKYLKTAPELIEDRLSAIIGSLRRVSLF